ncbi:MAG: dihydroorotate dehydrogenase electron transfer subunit [Pirellulales bacterium]
MPVAPMEDRPANALHASYLADRASQQSAQIEENVRLAGGMFRMRIACPAIARQAVPGQFVMLRFDGRTDPLVGRPMAIYETVDDRQGEPWAIDVVYQVIGKMTSLMATCPVGGGIDLWGPLGNGFLPRPVSHLVMVAGGIGLTPFLALAHEALGVRRYGSPARTAAPAERVTLCYGVRSRDLLIDLTAFQQAGVDVRLASDDGSVGHHGLVTDLLDVVLHEDSTVERIVCCGPERMMAGAARLAQDASVPCDVSLETPMACGIGICFSCVARIRQSDGSWDYKRTCVEGPVFAAETIVWE